MRLTGTVETKQIKLCQKPGFILLYLYFALIETVCAVYRVFLVRVEFCQEVGNTVPG